MTGLLNSIQGGVHNNPLFPDPRRQDLQVAASAILNRTPVCTGKVRKESPRRLKK